MQDQGAAQPLGQAHVGLLVSSLETSIANGAANVEHAAGALMQARSIAAAVGIPWAANLTDVQGLLTAEGAVDLMARASKKMIAA